VGYPILDLNNYKKSISWYMRSLEQVIIDTLNLYGLEAIRKDGLTGVWIGDEKIAALGVRISRWVTMHGFALNVNTNLDYYDGIIPCGLLEYGVTSMEKLFNYKINMDDMKKNLISCFRNIFLMN
ncbi:MAG TPA: lipoyl(octanoyl) transferase LipB, partial [Candidatus Marinimicrobia bacterium]|nr:lipoyl(octanoyl) transferase LipB [Candidatus Neomarinimicrobiota bacterium]